MINTPFYPFSFGGPEDVENITKGVLSGCPEEVEQIVKLSRATLLV